MRNFGAVSPMFWIGKTGRSLRSDRDAQVLAAYLMTCPLSHQTGIYYLPLTMISTETGIPLEGALKALRRVENEGFSQYSLELEWVWVREMALWQIGEPSSDGDKRIVGVQNYYRDLPELPFLTDFFDRYEKTYRLKVRRENLSTTKELGRGFQGPSIPHGSHTHTHTHTQDHTQEGGVGETKNAAKLSTSAAVKRARKPRDEPTEFAELRSRYPKRDGSQRWGDAVRFYLARLAEGHTHARIMQGVDAYAAHCTTTGKTGTDKVLQAATFLGENRAFLEDYATKPKTNCNGLPADPLKAKHDSLAAAEWRQLREEASRVGFRDPVGTETADHFRAQLKTYQRRCEETVAGKLNVAGLLKSP